MTALHERTGVAGSIFYRVFKNDRLIETVNDHNLVVNGGRNWLARLVCGDDNNRITKLGLGTSADVELLSDSSLMNCHVVALSSHSVGSSSLEGFSAAVTFNWSLEKADANGLLIREFGLFTANDVLVTRQVRGSVIGKADDIRIEGTYTLHF